MQFNLMKSISSQIENLKTPMSFDDVYISSSLETMENDFWGPPTYPSNLATTIHKIRTLPLNQLTNEHLRMSIGQKMSLPYLVPLAVKKLKGNPLAEGDMYEGALLMQILRIPNEYFEWDRNIVTSICSVAQKAHDMLKAKDVGELDEVDNEIIISIIKFIEKYQAI